MDTLQENTESTEYEGERERERERDGISATPSV